MKQAEVQIGKTYLIRFHDGFLTPVTVISKKERLHRDRYDYREIVGSHDGYVCRNERTGREIVIKTASKFRDRVERIPESGKWRIVN